MAEPPNAGMMRAMAEMEEFERKHMVAANRGKFFAADPPHSANKLDAIAKAGVAQESMVVDLIKLKERLTAEYADKRAEWDAPPQVEQFTGVTGDLTPLHSAAQYGDLDVVQRLITNGQDSNEVSPGGLTPLLMAARHGQNEVVRWLLCECKPRGNYNLRDPDGNTVHTLAGRNGHTSTLRFLVDLLKKEFDMKESRRLCTLKNNNGCVCMPELSQA